MAILMAFSVVFTAFYGRYKIGDDGVDNSRAEYKGILTLWHVDSFEGGTGSRKQFLLKSARGFEKVNQGVLVMVINHTAESVRENVKNGVYPDMISYGAGLDVNVYSEFDISKTVSGGMIGDKTYATAWCRGGYVLISNPKLVSEQKKDLENLVVSLGDYTQPLVAFALNGYTARHIEVMKPMDAYVRFTGGKTPYFLGTQRDVNRLNARGMEYKATPLEEYNDLYQYISITGVDELKRYYAEEFIRYIVSENVQRKLNGIGMLSAFCDAEYDVGTLRDMQSVKNFSTVSAFTPSAVLKEIQADSLVAAAGDTETLNKIKKMLL